MASTTVLVGRNTMQHGARGASRGGEATWYRKHDPKGRVVSIDLIFKRVKSSNKLTLESVKEVQPTAEKVIDFAALALVEQIMAPQEASETAKPSGWGSLPRDILETIAAQLEPADIRAARSVNKHWDATCAGRMQRLCPSDPLQDSDIPALAAKYPALRTLHLCRSFELTDSGVSELLALGKLESLSLARCYRLTGAALRVLRGLPKLASLDLSWCYHVPAQDLEALPDLTGLTHLSLAHTALSDAGLARVAQMPSLASLDLTGCTKIGDEGLAHLSSMTSLRKLDLSGCKVSTMAIKNLRAEFGKQLSVYVYSRHNHHK